MSQATSLTLAAHISGASQRDQINDMIEALNTGQSGLSRPTTAAEGTLWVDTSGGSTAYLLKMYDGISDDIIVGTINLAAGTFTPAGQLATFANTVVPKTGSFTLNSAAFGQVFTCNATSGAITATVPDVSTLVASWFAIIKKTDSTTNVVNIAMTGGQTIDGVTGPRVLTRQGQGAIVIKATSTTAITIPFYNDNLLQQSASDTTPGTLSDKTAAGNGIAFSTTNPGANEKLAIAVDVISGTGALGFSGGKVGVNYDNTTITQSGNILQVNHGTTANKIVRLDGSARLPAVDASQLTNLPAPLGSGVAKVLLNYNGSSNSIRSSFGVSSVTKISSGNYTINFSSSFANVNYYPLMDAFDSASNILDVRSRYSIGVGSISVTTRLTASNTIVDTEYLIVAIFAN